MSNQTNKKGPGENRRPYQTKNTMTKVTNLNVTDILRNLPPVTAKCSPFWNIDIDRTLINYGWEYQEHGNLSFSYTKHDCRILFQSDVVSYQYHEQLANNTWKFETLYTFTLPRSVDAFKSILSCYSITLN